MPDRDLVTAAGPVRTFELMARARPVLLGLGEPGGLDAPARAWADRVTVVDARPAGLAPWTLPVVGPVRAPEAVLVRPDGHVAWVGEGTHAGLADALEAWFGPPRATAR